MSFVRVDNIPTQRGIDVEQFRPGVELAYDPANLDGSFKWDEPVKSKSIKAKIVEHFNLGDFNEHGIRVEIGFRPIKGQVEETYEIPATEATTRPATETELNAGVPTDEDGNVSVPGTPASTGKRTVEKEVAFDMYFYGTKDPKPERKPRAKKDPAAKPAAGRGRAAAK